jgi:hypothetical protein
MKEAEVKSTDIDYREEIAIEKVLSQLLCDAKVKARIEVSPLWRQYACPVGLKFRFVPEKTSES